MDADIYEMEHGRGPGKRKKGRATPVSTEPDLFDAKKEPEPMARASDPDTSKDAAAGVARHELSRRRMAILTLFHMLGPMHDDELLRRYAQYREVQPDTFPHQSESGIRSRRAELVDSKLLRFSGKKVTLPSGNLSRVWEVNPA